jgi:hypothetical protein
VFPQQEVASRDISKREKLLGFHRDVSAFEDQAMHEMFTTCSRVLPLLCSYDRGTGSVRRAADDGHFPLHMAQLAASLHLCPSCQWRDSEFTLLQFSHISFRYLSLVSVSEELKAFEKCSVKYCAPIPEMNLLSAVLVNAFLLT